ncbi:MAG: diguanylate cyclase [Deltaproteobacteria bacterium]|nr:diguanylate cyclase [Deltaproteobacteria bacterium]
MSKNRDHKKYKVGKQQGVNIMASKDFLDKLVLMCPDGIIGVSREGTVIIFNEAAEKLTGLNAEDVLGKLSITDVYRYPELARDIKKKLYSPNYGGVGRVDGIEIYVKGSGGQKVPIRLSASLLNENRKEIGSVGFFHDLTERKQLEEELRRRSITDSLTGLYNRRHFHTILGDEAKRSGRYNRHLMLAFFDLDNFKPFNDNYGHQEGDNILRLVGESMKTMLRSTDYAFRVGGDEFAFLMVETDLEHGAPALERFRTIFNERWPLRMSYLGSKLKPVTMSIGVAQLADNEKSDKLQLRVDLAMYEAKSAGGNCMVCASEEIGIKDQNRSLPTAESHP